MRKTYFMPLTQVTEVKTENIMNAVSGNGTPVSFSDAVAGEDGESADGRRSGFSVWDDED